MAYPFSIVNESTREEFLSGDFTRAQGLGSAQLQNVIRDDTRSDDATDSSGAFTVSTGAAIPGGGLVPTLAIVSGFTARVSAGEIFATNGSATGLSDDTSDYAVLRWAQTDILFDTPDPSNPRIDLLYLTIGSESTDLQSRNILLDPIARTVATANVPKKINPLSTIGYVAGTPAGSPVAPSLPGGTYALLEVLVPAAAPDASTFYPSRRQQRRAYYPISSVHGILQDCKLLWSVVNETTTPSDISIGFTNVSKVVIDGEVIAFGDFASAFFQDTSADPFGTSAPATNDRPYFIYAVGGRNLPQGTLANGGTELFPISIVESLTAPNLDGHPSSPIMTPRGATQAGALYIGVGFTVQNSTRRKGCSINGDWVYPLTGQGAGAAISSQPYAAFNDNAARVLATGVNNLTLAARPSTSTAAKVFALFSDANPGSFVQLGRRLSAGVLYAQSVAQVNNSGNAWTSFDLDLAAGATVGYATAAFASASLAVWATGYNMNVRRLNASI